MKGGAGLDVRSSAIAVVLAVLMVLTRGAHVASSVSLPDASLAVFFLAGLAFARLRVFAGFLALAVAIDAWVIGAQGVSAACVSGAYAFLLPAYACLWLAGRRTADSTASPFLGRAALRIAIASGLAFFISNGSYYAFGGAAARMSYAHYLALTGHYVVPYVGSALLYGGAVLVLREPFRHALAFLRGRRFTVTQ